MWILTVANYSRCHPDICLEGLRNTTKIPESRQSLSPHECSFFSTSTRSDILFSLRFFCSVFQKVLIIPAFLILCRTLNSSTVLLWCIVTCSLRTQEILSLRRHVFLLLHSRAQKNQKCTECALEAAVGLILTDGFPPLILLDCINQSSDVRCVIIGWLVRWLAGFKIQTLLSAFYFCSFSQSLCVSQYWQLHRFTPPDVVSTQGPKP